MKPVTIGDITGYVAESAGSTMPPILLIHGIFGGAWYFERFQLHLASLGFTSLAIDLRGHLGSRPVTDLGRVSIIDYVSDARQAITWLLEQYKQTPVVMGHSMGGLVAQKLAEDESLAALVLLTPAPPRGVPLWNPRLLPRQAKYLPTLLLQRTLEPDLEELADVAMNRMPDVERREALARCVPDSGRAALEISLGLIGVQPDRVQCPVVCVVGNEDRFIPPAVVRGVARRYRAPTWLYPEHGHFFIAEPGYQRLAGDIARWVEHVVELRTNPTIVADLWQGLGELTGRVADLTYFDDRRLRVEIIATEPGLRRGVRFKYLETRNDGSVPFRAPGRGSELRAALHELRSVAPV